MAFDRKSIGENEEVKPYLDGLEGRIKGAVDDLESKVTTSEWKEWNDIISYKVKNDIVMLRGGSFGTHNIAADKFITIGRLGASLKPDLQQNFPIAVFDSTHAGGFMRIESNGDVKLWMKGRASSYWGFSVMYFKS